MSASLHPELLWAQTDKVVYITIPLADSTDNKVEFLPQAIKYEGKSSDSSYAVDLGLFKEYDNENSRYDVTAQRIFLVLKKSEDDTSFWPRLHRSGKKPAFIKVDFARWRDEDDEEEEQPDLGLGNFGQGLQDVSDDEFDDEFEQTGEVAGEKKEEEEETKEEPSTSENIQ
ncbi:HSP20-like chaperone [Neoconidiobolus thromboides FSU 785]|nr:HSP20-like chaperone [Neoconidiobolus thromboides FSU 785]